MSKESKIGFDNLEEDELWDIMGTGDDNDFVDIADDAPEPAPAKPTEEPTPEPEPDEDEEEEVDADEEEDASDETDSDENEDDNPAGYFAKLFAEKGLLTIPEGLDIKDDEDLDKVIEHTIKEGVEQYKKGLGEEALKILEFVENGGNIEDYIEVAQENPSFDSLDIEDEENQKALYAEYLKRTTKFSDAKIAKLVEQADVDLELEDNAKEAQEFFKQESEAAKAEIVKLQRAHQERVVQEREEFLNTTKSIITAEKEIFDMPLGDKKKRQELEDYMLKATVPYETKDGRKILITQMQADKIALNEDKDKKYKAFIFEAIQLKNNFNLDPIKSKRTTEENSKLRELANKHKSKSTTGSLSKSGGKSAPRASRKLLFETDF